MSAAEKLSLLKRKVFEQNNSHCFIERERFLADNAKNYGDTPHRYAEMLSDMLDRVSTPVCECDIFVGRVLEDAPDDGMSAPCREIFAKGHLTPNYEKLLRIGYKGILAEIKQNSQRIGTTEALEYAKNAETVINAVNRFAIRYSEAAAASGNLRASEALKKVPLEPAYDLFSALQCIWLMHMIASCYVGSRDYAFGYMDEYLYPYYLTEKENGATDEDICNMLAGFVIKTNEICGRHTHNYMQKPILSQASKQYLLLDGARANELSVLILEAARRNCMAQPTVTVILSQTSSDAFKSAVFGAMTDLTDKMQVYNFELMSGFLRSRGLPDELCRHPAVSACCTFDIANHAVREEFYLPTVEIFCKVLIEGNYSSAEELLADYSSEITKAAQNYLEDSRYPDMDWCRKVFVLDTLLLEGCNEACAYPPRALKYRAKNIFLPGIATLGNSLCALENVVFSGKASYGDLVEALKADFVGYERLHALLSSCPKFGNDSEQDFHTVRMADLLISAVNAADHKDNEVVAPSFYSLERDNSWAEITPATPDGRRSGQPFSENQSPVYGTDKNGITALLCSVSKLPFERTAAGGLNLTFSSPITPELLQALVTSYFEQGGLHVGITVLDRAVLEDAMEHPEKYPALTVRLYGFSEYFICLPRWQQIAVLNRTAY